MSLLYTIDQMKWLSDRFEEDGLTPEQVNLIGSGGRLRMIKAYLDGDADIMPKVVKPTKKSAFYLRLVSGGETLTISACKGKRTIAKAKTVFRGYIDPDFVNYGLDVEGVATPNTDVEVHELVRNGKFVDIYANVGVPLDNLVMTQGQVISFCETHQDWLRMDGYGTFFLVKKDNEFFVASVRVCPFGLHVRAHRLSLDHVWDGEDRHRFVFPQLTAPVVA
ncbi:MAG: hypothetical protein WCW47_01200 [Candidatus Paceibacterota bacterium]